MSFTAKMPSASLTTAMDRSPMRTASGMSSARSASAATRCQSAMMLPLCCSGNYRAPPPVSNPSGGHAVLVRRGALAFGPGGEGDVLHRVMRAEDQHLRIRLMRQRPDAALLGADQRAGPGHRRLVGRAAGRAMRRLGEDLGAVEVGVAGMQHPAARRLDGNARMPRGMAGQRHEGEFLR